MDMDLPTLPSLSPRLRRAFLRDDAEHFGRLDFDGWMGVFARSTPLARPWLPSLGADEGDWRAAFAKVLHGLDSGRWTRFKHDASGTVAAGSLRLGGVDVEVVAKRPRRTRASQWALDLARPPRALRAWRRTWALLAAGFAAEVPLALWQRRTLGVTHDQIGIYARVPGPTLQAISLGELAPTARRKLLWRAGKTLGELGRTGLGHFDAKATNWVVYDGNWPVMIDCDGVRPSRRDRGRAGLARLSRSLRDRGDATDDDLAALAEGWAGAFQTR